jgi:hypothetical protein
MSYAIGICGRGMEYPVCERLLPDMWAEIIVVTFQHLRHAPHTKECHAGILQVLYGGVNSQTVLDLPFRPSLEVLDDVARGL